MPPLGIVAALCCCGVLCGPVQSLLLPLKYPQPGIAFIGKV
jgi:hypothetical protein